MLIKALIGIYVFILGFLVWERCSIVLSQLSEMPTPRMPDLIAAALTTTFFAGYLAYLVTRSRMLLGLTFIVYCAYAVRAIVQTYIYPLLTEQEYIWAIALYFVLGLPMLVALVVNFKHNKSSNTDAASRTGS